MSDLPHAAIGKRNCAHPVRPIDESNLASAGNEALMRHPLHAILAFVNTTRIACAVGNPDPVGEGAGIENEVVVGGTKLRMSDGVAFQKDPRGLLLSIDQHKTRNLSHFHGHGPPAAIGRRRWVPMAAPTMPFSRISTSPKAASWSSTKVSSQ